MKMMTKTQKLGRISAALVLIGIAMCLLRRFDFPPDADMGLMAAPTQPDANTARPQEPPAYELFGLPKFGESVEVATLHMVARTSNGTPPTNQELPIAMPKFNKMRLASSPLADGDQVPPPLPASATVTVDVAPPASPPRDTKEIIFGVATTFGRLPDALRGFKYWAAHTNVHFVIVAEPPNNDEPTKKQIEHLFQQEGIRLTLIVSKAGFIDRYVSLIGHLFDHVEPHTKWVSIIDDDTFFFDVGQLLAMLSKYDPREPYYVGRMFENKWDINDAGIFALGGAGVFMSVALLAQLAPHRDDCLHLPNPNGDKRVADCIMKWTTTRLTTEPGLYQLDLQGDASGFYEALRPQPISVHHWRSWHRCDMPTVVAIAAICGKACPLQHFTFADGWRMTNGFSIVKYAYTAEQRKGQIAAAMEHTWALTNKDIDDSWTYSLAPLRPKDDGKVQFLMEKAVEDPQKGDMTLYYVKRREGVGEAVIRVVWSKA